MTAPRIYVACLAAYNAGKLHGRWIDATQDAEDIRAEVAAMLAESPEPGAEEWAIHDYEGFEGIEIGEWEDFDKVSELAAGLEQNGEAFGAFIASGREPDDFEEAFAGTWDSEQDYAEDFVDSTGMLGECPDNIAMYFDYEKFTRDLFMDYWSAPASSYGVHVFRSF